MAKKIKNGRCPLQKECGRSCSYVNDELGCDYYKNNAVGDSVIPDQEELRAKLEAVRLQIEDAEAIESLVLSEDEPMGEGEKKIVYLPIGELFPHPDNPRKDLGDLSELSESIRARGVLQNLLVIEGHYVADGSAGHRLEEGGYTVIIGHKRRAAAEIAGLSHLPCVIEEMSYQEQLETMLIENVQRSDLTAYEQAKGFQLIMDLGGSVAGIAQKTGFSETTVRRRLEMAKLDGKVMKKVSERQLSFADFDKLTEIKSMKKRNEVLEKIGTHNFESAIENAVREEKIAARMPLFIKKAEELGAKKMKDEDRWSSKYEQIASVRVTEEGAEDKVLVPKKYQNAPLFYSVREYWGDLEIYRKKPKAEAVKRPKAEIEREKRIAECKRQLKGLEDMARDLRAKFVRELVMHSKNEKALLMGAAQALAVGVCSYQYGLNAKSVLELLGKETSAEYGKNDKLFRAALEECPERVIPAVILLAFENNKTASYVQEVYNDFPKHKESNRLDKLYAWLCSLGYEMSDDEIALQKGTHEAFHMGKEEQK